MGDQKPILRSAEGNDWDMSIGAVVDVTPAAGLQSKLLSMCGRLTRDFEAGQTLGTVADRRCFEFDAVEPAEDLYVHVVDVT